MLTNKSDRAQGNYHQVKLYSLRNLLPLFRSVKQRSGFTQLRRNHSHSHSHSKSHHQHHDVAKLTPEATAKILTTKMADRLQSRVFSVIGQNENLSRPLFHKGKYGNPWDTWYVFLKIFGHLFIVLKGIKCRATVPSSQKITN